MLHTFLSPGSCRSSCNFFVTPPLLPTHSILSTLFLFFFTSSLPLISPLTFPQKIPSTFTLIYFLLYPLFMFFQSNISFYKKRGEIKELREIKKRENGEIDTLSCSNGIQGEGREKYGEGKKIFLGRVEGRKQGIDSELW